MSTIAQLAALISSHDIQLTLLDARLLTGIDDKEYVLSNTIDHIYTTCYILCTIARSISCKLLRQCDAG